MSRALSIIGRHTPCCARVTPTRTSDWRRVLDRLAEGSRGAWRAALQRLRGHERLPEFDAATMRDLGLSHAPASWTAREDRAAARR